MNDILRRVEVIFFDAMLDGWANPNVKKGRLIQLPESKVIRFEKDGFRVFDFYLTNPGTNNSMGNTVIWKDKRPVWMMSYGGRYPKEVLPFLKQALLTAYQNREFFGGRGRQFFEDDAYTYVNSITRGSFTSFMGEERIFEKRTGDIVGWHYYWGMSLG